MTKKAYAVTVELIVLTDEGLSPMDIVDNVLFNYDVRYGLITDWTHLKTSEGCKFDPDDNPSIGGKDDEK